MVTKHIHEFQTLNRTGKQSWTWCDECGLNIYVGQNETEVYYSHKSQYGYTRLAEVKYDITTD